MKNLNSETGIITCNGFTREVHTVIGYLLVIDEMQKLSDKLECDLQKTAKYEANGNVELF